MAKNTTTRWDALSMRDRASLIKLYSQSGIRKLDDIRAHYNKFETGGDKKDGVSVGWLQNLLLNKAASKAADFAGDLLTKDEAKTILENPTDYAEYLGWNEDTINEKKRNFYKNSEPWGYDLLSAREAVGGNKGQKYPSKTTLSQRMARDYLFAEYLGIPQKERKEPLAYKMFETSPYKPSMGGDGEKYIRFSTDYNRNKIVDIYNSLLSNIHYRPGSHKMKAGRDYMTSFDGSSYRIEPGKSGNNLVVSIMGEHDFNTDPYTASLGQYTLGTGYDNNRGQYISIYDRWDLNPFQYPIYPLPRMLYKKFEALGDASGGFGKPVNFYDRVYLDDYYGVDSRPKSPDEFYGGYIVPAVVTSDKAHGGSIHNNRFDTGGDKTNDALAKAIIDRVNQEEAAKAKAESVIMGEVPLENEDYLLGTAAASTYGLATAGLKGAGRAIARGINWLGEKAMPSALLKSPVWKGATAKALSSIAPYADAGVLSYWSAKGLNNAIQEWNNGNKIDAAANATLASLPVAAVTASRIRNIANTIEDAIISNTPAKLSKERSGASIVFSKYGAQAIKKGMSNIAKYNKIVSRRAKSGAWEDGIKFARDKYASSADILDKNFKIAQGMTEAQAIDPNIPRVVGNADVLNKLPKIKITNPLIGIFSDDGGHYSRGIRGFGKPKPSITLNPYEFNRIMTAFNEPLGALRRLNQDTAHEGTHWALDQLRTFGGTKLGGKNSPIVEGISMPASEYYIANTKHPLFKTVTNIFNDKSRKTGWWERSPEEFAAEQTAAQFRMGISPELPYKDWDARKKLQINKFLGARFDMNPEQATSVSEGLSSFGYKNGGPIHIKPENRGKFNALLKRTDKSASWFKEHGTPLQRKRATFALNARKWKHPDGGEINVLGNPSYNKAQEEYMYRYLKDSGMDDTHVAAIMGNIAVESGLNADKKQIKGPAWGLIQAEGSRQEAIKNYNDVPYLFGSKLSPEEQRQLDYIIEKGIRTYTPGEWGMAGFKEARQARKGFINETDLTKATDIFMRNYERPSKQHRNWRQNMSKYYYDKYKEPEYYVPLDFFNK